MAGKLWVRLVRRNRLAGDVIVPCADRQWREGLAAACRALDVQVPLIVPRHDRDFIHFAQTRFLQEHFMEPVSFDRMEVEYFDPDAPRTLPDS